MTQIVVRKARPIDASNLIRLLEEAHDENPLYPHRDQHMALNWIANTLSSGYVVVADLSGRIVGTLALTNYRFPFSPQWYMYLEWLAVQKRFRGEGTFDALMAAAHAYADDKKAPILAGISAAGEDVFVKDRLMQMKGYTYIGGTFIRSAENGVKQQQVERDIHAA